MIDHDSKEGFEAVAAARLHLLSLGQKDLLDQTSDVSGCHVVAPVSYTSRWLVLLLADDLVVSS